SDVGVRTHAAVAHRLEAQGAGAHNAYAIAAHLAEHAKDVEHRLGDAVRRQIPEPLEVPLPLEFKRPGDGAHQIHALQVRQLIGARDLLCGVARIHGAVAIAVLWMRADRARRAPQNGYRNGTMYTSYTAEQIARTYQLADLQGVNLMGAVTWAFEFEGQRYFEGFRDLATNGIAKPVLNLFRMLGQMGGDRVRVASTV